MSLSIVAFSSDSCGYPQRSFIGPSSVSFGDLSPMEQTWSRGETVMPYATDYSEIIASWMPAPSPTLELRRLIDSQPRVGKRQSPFTPIDTRSHELPSEHSKARAAGRRMLSLDLPVSGADDGGTLADQVVGTNDVSFTTVDPTTAFRIESERRAVLSGPLLRTRVERSPNGSPWVRTRGAPFANRLRIERLRDELVYVFDDATLTRAHYQRLEERYGRWVRSWAPQVHSIGALAALGRSMAGLRRRGRRPVDDPFETDPFRLRFTDQLLDEPFEEPVIDVTDDEAIERFGRPLDLCYPEEVDELVAEAAERMTDAGEIVPVRRHLRTHDNWTQASASRLHSEGAEYLASAADILG